MKSHTITRLILAIPALAPLYLVRGTVFGVPTNLFEVLFLGIAALYIYHQGISWAWREGHLRVPILAALAIVCGAALSMADNPTAASLGGLKGFVIEVVFAGILLVRAAGAFPEAKKRLTEAMAIGAGCIAAVAAGYALAGVFTYDGRLVGPYDSPNQLAMALMPGALAAVAYAWHTRSRLSGVAALILFFAVAATHSGGAVIGYLAAIMAGALAARQQKVWLRAEFVGLALFSLLLPIAFIYTPDLPRILGTDTRSSLSSRQTIWRVSGDILRQQPLRGIGTGNFQAAYLAEQPRYEPYLEWAVPHPHNTALSFLLYAGILGFAGYGILVSWLILRGGAAPDIPQKTYTILGSMLLAYLLVHGSVDTLYWRQDIGLLLWCVAALLVQTKTPVQPGE